MQPCYVWQDLYLFLFFISKPQLVLMFDRFPHRAARWGTSPEFKYFKRRNYNKISDGNICSCFTRRIRNSEFVMFDQSVF